MPYDPDLDDDPDFGEEDDLPFDCHMDRNGQCGAAGSEDCDFECPVMAAIHREDARKRAAKKKGKR